MRKEVYEDMAKVELNHWWFKARTKIVDGLITKFVLPRRKTGAAGEMQILDLGCGSGNNGRMLSQYGKVDGIEPDQFALDIAEARGSYRELVQGIPTVDGTKPKDSFYDMVVMTDVLEHIEDHEAALDLVKNSLKPGGSLVLTVPALMWLWSNHDETHLHYRRYTKSLLTEVVSSTGFEVQVISYFNSFLFPLIAAVRLIKKLLPQSKEKADTGLPSKIINYFLYLIFRSEGYLINLGVRFPIGVSVLLVCSKPDAE